MLKPWDELTPDEKLEVVNQIADPGLSWPIRAGLLYEYLRLKWLINQSGD